MVLGERNFKGERSAAPLRGSGWLMQLPVGCEGWEFLSTEINNIKVR